MAGQRVLVSTRRPAYVIGSDARCDLVLADPGVAPVHALVGVENAVYFIRPRSNTSQVFVNGERVIEPTCLSSGDIVQIGAVELVFRQKADVSGRANVRPFSVPFDPEQPASGEARLDASKPAVEPYVWKRRTQSAPAPALVVGSVPVEPVRALQPLKKTNNITGIVASIISIIVLVALVGYAVANQLTRAAAPNPYDIYTPGTVHILTFYADWCHYCKQQDPIVRRIDREFGEAVVVEFVDVENPENRALVSEYGAASIPTTVILNDRWELKSRWIGLTDADKLRASVEQVLAESPPVTPLDA